MAPWFFCPLHVMLLALPPPVSLSLVRYGVNSSFLLDLPLDCLALVRILLYCLPKFFTASFSCFMYVTALSIQVSFAQELCLSMFTLLLLLLFLSFLAFFCSFFFSFLASFFSFLSAFLAAFLAFFLFFLSLFLPAPLALFFLLFFFFNPFSFLPLFLAPFFLFLLFPFFLLLFAPFSLPFFLWSPFFFLSPFFSDFLRFLPFLFFFSFFFRLLPLPLPLPESAALTSLSWESSATLCSSLETSAPERATSAAPARQRRRNLFISFSCAGDGGEITPALDVQAL